MTRPDRTRAEQAIAFLVAQIRPDWQQAGVLAALRKVSEQPLDRTAAAAIHCATHRQDQRSPDVIARDGEHWQAIDRMVGRPPGTGPEARCPDHHERLPCLTCQRDARGPLPSAERIRQIRAEARQALEGARNA